MNTPIARIRLLIALLGDPLAVLVALAVLVGVTLAVQYVLPAPPPPPQEAALRIEANTPELSVVPHFTPPADPAPARVWHPKMPEPTPLAADAARPAATPQPSATAVGVVPPTSAPAPPAVGPVPGAPVVRIPAPAESVFVNVAADGTITSGIPPTPENLLKEVKHLQEKFDQLQDTLNIVVTEMMSDVQKENVELRSEVKRLQARDQAGLLATNAVPRPGGELFNQLAQEVRDNPDDLGIAPGPPPAFSFQIFKEWGRDAAAVQQLGGSAPTLKGVVGFVPPGSAREDIEQLGRDLRKKYNIYDNINIEVFDDPIAAQAFIDKQALDPEHRVLSVSKYSSTGHDTVTYYEGGAGTDLAPMSPEESAAADPNALEPAPEPAATSEPGAAAEPAPDAPDAAAAPEEPTASIVKSTQGPAPEAPPAEPTPKKRGKHDTTKKPRSGR